MYSYEICSFINSKKHNISNYDYLAIIDSSPQIIHVKFEPFNNIYKIATNDNYNFEFRVYAQ